MMPFRIVGAVDVPAPEAVRGLRYDRRAGSLHLPEVSVDVVDVRLHRLRWAFRVDDQTAWRPGVRSPPKADQLRQLSSRRSYLRPLIRS